MFTSHKYYSDDQMKKNEMGGACGTHGRLDRYIQGFRREGADGKLLLGKPRRRSEGNIKMDLKEVR